MKIFFSVPHLYPGFATCCMGCGKGADPLGPGGLDLLFGNYLQQSTNLHNPPVMCFSPKGFGILLLIFVTPAMLGQLCLCNFCVFF